MKSWSGAASPQKAVNTTELTRRIQAGSRMAEEEFVETYSHSIRLLLLYKTQNPDMAKDCCQQTLLITLIKIRAGDIVKPESLLSFLRHTATNVATTHFRKERRYIPLNDEAFSAPRGISNDAEQDKDSETIRLMLNDILDLLTVERDREVLRRFYLRDEEKSIIRRDLDLSATHFDRVLYRAKIRLRRLLDRHEDVKNLFRQSLSNRMHKRPVHKRPGQPRLQTAN
jgi:RNA polymerase sigma-70 factor (ECF subfamily)